MIKFISKFILFLTPLLFIFILPLYIYWQAREFTQVQTVVREQNGKEQVLFGLAYGQVTKAYKESLVLDRNPRIITLGTSRVMQFRGDFFASSTHFVNVGGGVVDIRGFSSFISDLPLSIQPDMVLVALDPWMFNPGRPLVPGKEQVSLAERAHKFLIEGWRNVYVDYFASKFSLSSIAEARNNTSAIGLNAIMRKNGFLNDGSFFYGSTVGDALYLSKVQQMITDEYDSIRQDHSNAEYGASISPESLKAVKDFLALCKERHIQVVGFIPPYPLPIYQELLQNQDTYAQSAKILPIELKKIFEQYQFSLFDYTDGRVAHIKESEFIDATHVSDKGDLRILIDMAQKDPILRHYVSLSKLRSLLQDTRGDFILTSIN